MERTGSPTKGLVWVLAWALGQEARRKTSRFEQALRQLSPEEQYAILELFRDHRPPRAIADDTRCYWLKQPDGGYQLPIDMGTYMIVRENEDHSNWQFWVMPKVNSPGRRLILHTQLSQAYPVFKAAENYLFKVDPERHNQTLITGPTTGWHADTISAGQIYSMRQADKFMPDRLISQAADKKMSKGQANCCLIVTHAMRNLWFDGHPKYQGVEVQTSMFPK